ncbi:MAG: GTPase Era [Anaerovoracaceae bacterium]|jgi:GTP-binding protein Era|nr:GTPase Era [Anaerovoracaceae bacterium]
MKSGFIGIIGRPNVGKSTLLNAIIGEKIAITTSKPQTTRNTIRGIYSQENLQMVFIDTPGIHKPKNKLGSFMTQQALRTFEEVDAIVLIIDDELGKGPGDAYILDLLKEVKTPKILVINKIDTMEPDKYQRVFEAYEAFSVFEKIIGISALSGKNVSLLIDSLGEFMKEGPAYFPTDMITDHPERFIVSEIIREKTLLYLDEEVPHGIAIEIESYQESEKLTRISAIIYCEKKSHKGIIIGKDGKKLKGIGKQARLEIEGLLATKVFLELWVKVRENWRDSDFSLSNFGYKE